MKNINKFLLALLSVVIVLAACTKERPLFYFKSGEVPVLTMRDTVISPRPQDSSDYRARFNFSNPQMATPLSNVVFRTEIDLADGDFSNPLTTSVSGVFNDSIQNKVLNAFVLSKGVPFGELKVLKARTIASYSNNNNQLQSNIVNFRFRTYKVPPRVTLPVSNRLFIVGSATKASWNLPLINNGVDYSVSQEFIRVDETTYAAKIFLYGGESYLMVPLNNGSGWDLKYAITNSSAPNASSSGPFGHRPSSAAFDVNFPSPAVEGWYKMTFDFQTGNYTVVDSKNTPVPDSLYAIGDATLGEWDNSHGNNPLKNQYFNKLNSGIFERTLSLKAGKQLKFITAITKWQPQFGRGTNAGELGYNYMPTGGTDPASIIISADGNYKVRVDFLNMTYTLTKL